MKYRQLVFMTTLILLLILHLARLFVNAKPTPSEAHTDESSLIREKIAAFKSDILNRLGYVNPPNVSNVNISMQEKRKMITLYRKYIEEREGTHKDEDVSGMVHSRNVHTLEYAEQIPSGIQLEAWKTQHAYRLYFNTSLSHPDDAAKELHIHSAKLILFKMAVRPENLKDKFTVDKAIRVNIYQILSFKSNSDYKRKLIDSKIVSIASTGWETFDIKHAVQDWVDSPENNIGIEIVSDSQNLDDVLDIAMSEPRKRNIFALTNATDYGNSTLPVLRFYTEERSILKRVKRDEDQEDCTIKDGEKKCCRYPIKISFREIGWDNWIIAPADYNGYYCAGSCPYTHKMANTFSAIKALLHLRNPSMVPSPCCYATRLRPFTILHYDENNRYTFSDYPDLIVDQCRCG